MWWINRFVSDKTRTVITNKFAKLGDNASRVKVLLLEDALMVLVSVQRSIVSLHL